MSVKLPKRLSSKKKKPPVNNVQTNILNELGLESIWKTPLDPTSMLNISTWTLEKVAPLALKDLPNAFLQRLWLLSPDARTPCCKPQQNVSNNVQKSTEEVSEDISEIQCAINPLDLVTTVFMSANAFLRQEMTARMVKCQFAVPLVIPNLDPEEPSHFLLWPLRGVVSQWRSHFPDQHKICEGSLASTSMPMVSCVKLGHCDVSKSQVLNSVIRSSCDTFLHRGTDGGQLPRRLSNGLVEIAWYLPSGDTATDIFPAPVVISNLRGDAGTHTKCLSLLCQASSALVIFCGNIKEKEKLLLASCKEKASKLIIINLSNPETEPNLIQDIRLLDGLVIEGGTLNEEGLAKRLCDTLKDLLPDNLKLVKLEAAAKLAEELGLREDEVAVCKKTMVTAEEVLKGLEEGPIQFKEQQLPLQGPLWSKLSETEKRERKQKKEDGKNDPQLLKEKNDIMAKLSSYEMTKAMKIFTKALFTRDKTERAFFLCWMKLKLQQMQTENQNRPQALLTKPENGATCEVEDSDSFCTDSFEEDQPEEQPADNELQVSETQLEMERELDSEETSEAQLQSRQKNNQEFTHDPAIMQQLCITNENEIQSEKYIEPNIYFEEQILHPVEKGTLICPGQQLEEQLSALATSDPTSSIQQLCLDVSTEQQAASCSQPSDPGQFVLSLEHFLREMGLIFELTHSSPQGRNKNILRLPSLAAELLIYGVPLELMDGDASNIPVHWLGCVFAELQRRLPLEQCRIRVLTSLGTHHSKNAEVLSALFAVKFPEGGSGKGVYMLTLNVPDNLKKEMECDFLFLIDVEGLSSDKQRNIQDNEMATVATGLSHIFMHHICAQASTEFETNLALIVSALLRIKECGSMPTCQFLVQGEGLHGVLQATQLKRVADILKNETDDKGTGHANKHCEQTTSCITFFKGPWHNMFLSEQVDMQYSKDVLRLKQNLFGTLRKCAPKADITGLSHFMVRLCAVWDVVRAESFSIGLQDTEVALGFSLLCTETSQWEESFREHMQHWFKLTTKKILATNSNNVIHNDILNGLKDEAKEEVKTEVGKLRSKVEARLLKDDLLKRSAFKPILLSNMDDLQERVTEDMIERLEMVSEKHCSSTQLEIFETLLEREKKSKLHELINNKSGKVLLQDEELEEEFEGLWKQILSDFNFRPSETDDITARVQNILKENLISRGIQKHMKKLEVLGQNQTNKFCIYDEHFGYRSRLKHMFDDNNRPQKLEAQQLACNIIEEYNQFVADKCDSPADFSDLYITELLENIERALEEKSMEIRSIFEVDLKIYLCNAASQDFQKLHNRYAKDRELLESISAKKSVYLAQFIYQFRKMDQCQRMAQAFTSMVFKPTVLRYVHKKLGTQIAEEIQAKAPQYRSQQAFHRSLLEDLIRDDCFEHFLEYLHSYDNFRLRKIQEAVVAHLSESTSLKKWRQQQLGDIVGMIAAAVSETAEGTSGALSDVKPLLERMCLTLEKDGDVDVTRAALDGPLFSFTIEWDYFVTCLLELLAAMRLDLVKEFSENVDIIEFLQNLPVKPHNYLFYRVKGCERQCPLCRTPCELEETGHEVHRAVLHRPMGMFPNNSCSQSSIRCLESTTKDNPDQRKNAGDLSVACSGLHDPDWNTSPEDPNIQIPSSYWRYVLVRYNERFAKEYQQEPAEIPEEWKKITEKEALDSLKEAFSGQH